MTETVLAPAILTDYARQMISVKASQLCRRSDFRRVDRSDLEQELWLAVCQKMKHYKPEKASLNTFTDRVINAAVDRMLQHHKRHKRQGHVSNTSLDEPSKACPETSTGDTISIRDVSRWTGVEVVDATAEFELDEAISTALQQMPDRLRILARKLMTQSCNSICRDNQMTRHALRQAMKEIRVFLESAGLKIYPQFRQLVRKRDM